MFYRCTKMKVRFGDCDMFGHLNNAKYITYLEQARVDYFRDFPGINFQAPQEKVNHSMILAEVTCSYKSPAFMDETLLVKVRTSELKRSSFIMEYELVEENTERLVATGRTVGVMYDYKAKKSVAIPEEFRKKFEEIEQREFY